MMKNPTSRLVLLTIMYFIIHLSVSAQPPTGLTILDDFTDGDYTANPTWNLVNGSGPWDIFSFFQRPNTVRTNMSSTNNPNGFSALSTPFSKICDAWQIDFLPATCPSAGRKVEYYFLMTNASNDPKAASGYKLSYHLQVLEGTTRRNFLYLQRVNNGVAVNPPIASYNNGTSCGLETITVTWNNGTWNLFVGNTLRGTGTDNTYTPSECAYQAISVVDSVLTTFGDTYRFDNIKYREATTTSVRGVVNDLSNLTFKAYPNPATDLLQINYNAKRNERAEIRLMDMHGRTLLNQLIFMNAGENRYHLNLSKMGISGGTYILKLLSGTNTETLKVVVQ
jgi:hypothetical protein